MRPKFQITFHVLALSAVVACADSPTVVLAPPSPALAVEVATYPISTKHTAALLARARQGDYSAAYRINDRGVAVGVSGYLYVGTSPYEEGTVRCWALGAAMWRSGHVVMLHDKIVHALGLDPCYTTTVAVDINNDGVVVGNVDVGETDDDASYGFAWSETLGVIAIRRLGSTHMAGINNRGVAVGHSFTEGPYQGGSSFGWTSTSGTYEIPGPEQPDATNWEQVLDIGEDGTVLGCSDGTLATWGGPGAPRVSSERCNQPPELPPYFNFEEYLGGSINAQGDVAFVGSLGHSPWSDTPYRWTVDEAAPTILGWTTGGAMGISDRNRIVGWRDTGGTPSRVAMTTRPRDGIAQLPQVSAGDASVAMGVNTCGSAVGYRIGSSGKNEAVLWHIARCDATGR